MNETTENGSASAADALGVISNQAFRRTSFLQRIALRLGLPRWSPYVVLLAVTAVVAYQVYKRLMWPERNATPVYVFMPVASAAEPQKQGFDGAWRDRHAAADQEFPNVVRYLFPLGRHPPTDGQIADVPAMTARFEELYDQGIRYFIVTMSDTVLQLTDGESDSAWAQFSARHPIDPPVLIATVASAPLPVGADVSRGVIRNYIRSDDEVNQFAAYLDARGRDLDTTELFVVYIKDRYGDKAIGLIRERIEPRVEIIGIEAESPTQEARAAEFDKVVSDLNEKIGNNALVILVGYGDMVVGMLDRLNNLAQRNPDRIDEVLVVSTLTEKTWQPDFYKRAAGQTQDQFIRRITTLAPFATGGADLPGKFKECEDGAVCQFSYMTLNVVLKCAAERSSDDFLDCFARRKNEVNGFPYIELSATGDSIVPLRVRVTSRPQAITVPLTP